MSSKFSSKIGILGGIGPAATAYAFQRLISICQAEYGAVQDGDFPDVIVTCLPLKGTDEFGIDSTVAVKEELRNELRDSSAVLHKAGAEIVYMACNTLHSDVAILEKADLQEVNMVASTADYVKTLKAGPTVTILGSSTTRRERLYAIAFIEAGLQSQEISDEIQEVINDLILAVMGNRDIENSRKVLKGLCSELLKSSDYVILACTELSLLLGQDTIQAGGIVDAQEVALRELLKRAQ